MPGTIGIGELLKDRYRLERTLGRGGMAAVWLGHDEVLDRPVAVKVLSDTIAGDPGFVARFRREAYTAAGLSHPNLVDVYDFSEEGERPYLVMQFVPGENLAERLERGRGVECERLARELLSALAHIHEAGILHRDVKPANVIVEPDGTAKLIDFGIALPRDATALTSTGLVLGTERYAAPEVMRGEPASERSDLYSCGVVLRACADGASPDLRGLVNWMASEGPDERPRSARAALARLERGGARPEQPTRAFEPTQVFEPPPADRPARTEGSRRGRWGAAAALLAFVVAVALVAALALGGGDDPAGPSRARSEAEAKPTTSQSPPQESEEPKFEEAGSNVAIPAPEGTDPGLGTTLNEEGFALIQAGEYEAAVPVLEEAVAAFPAGTEDLEYAYALFNLGNALRLSGRASEAVAVLERRLEIPNQTATVEEELAAARAEAE
ncbi:MAG TPA: serine/threonine-protein kinase [Solirubrobacterales bacterium]|nr:serine/threonine-protein kinase [Solirubrobacterales bacterium]